MNQSIKVIHCNGVTPSSFHMSKLNYATAITTSVIIIVSAAFSTVANALVIAALVRKKMLNSPLNLLLANMCLTDFLVGIVEQPIFVALRVMELRSIFSCTLRQVSAFLGYLCGGVTICTLCFISVDRWIAITMPFRYESVVTQRRCLALLGLVYISCTMLTLLGTFDVIKTKLYYLMVSFVLIALKIQALLCYAKIYKIARSHERRIDLARSIVLKTAFTRENETFTTNSGRGGSQKRIGVDAISQRRKSKTVLFMAVFLVICYLPKVCVIMDAFLFRKSESMSYTALKWSETLFLLNR